MYRPEPVARTSSAERVDPAGGSSTTERTETLLEVRAAATSRALGAVVGVLRVRAESVQYLTWRTGGDADGTFATLLVSIETSREAYVRQALRRLVDVIEVRAAAPSD